MAGEMFMTVNDVAEEMGISVSYAYRIIRRLNKELKENCCTGMSCKRFYRSCSSPDRGWYSFKGCGAYLSFSYRLQRRR